MTFSRSGFLTLAVIVPVTLWKLVRIGRSGFLWAALALAICAIPFAPSSYLSRLNTISDIEADPSGSAQERWSDLFAALTFIARNPIIGAGVGVDILALNEERGAKWKQVHNVYLQYGVDLGLPGVVLFVLLLAGAIVSNARLERQAPSDARAGPTAVRAAALRISLVGFAVAALFYPVSYQPYFFYLLGLSVALRRIAEAGQPEAAA